MMPLTMAETGREIRIRRIGGMDETRRFLEKVHFYEMHVFKYSKRTGTVAAGMPGQVPEPVKTARSNELLELERRQSKEFRTTYIGQVAEVLLEENKNINGAAWLVGHTEDYVKVALKAEDDMGRCRLNTMVKVKVSAFLTDEILAGELVL